jgi:hypothetical protein
MKMMKVEIFLFRPLLVVVELEGHSVVDFVVFESDVVLVDRVEFLDPKLVGVGAGLDNLYILCDQNYITLFFSLIFENVPGRLPIF